MKRFQIALLLTLFVAQQVLAPANFSGKATFSGKANFGAAAGGGGPNTWYDIESSATGDTQEFAGGSTTLEFASITPAQSGTCTKLRIWQQGNFGSFNVKMGLWNNDKSIITSANGTAASGANGAYIEVTLSSSVSVTGSTAYYIAWESDNANPIWYYKTGTGSRLFDNSGTYTYANFPNGSLPAGTSESRSFCVGMFVQ